MSRDNHSNIMGRSSRRESDPPPPSSGGNPTWQNDNGSNSNSNGNNNNDCYRHRHQPIKIPRRASGEDKPAGYRRLFAFDQAKNQAANKKSGTSISATPSNSASSIPSLNSSRQATMSSVQTTTNDAQNQQGTNNNAGNVAQQLDDGEQVRMSSGNHAVRRDASTDNDDAITPLTNTNNGDENIINQSSNNAAPSQAANNDDASTKQNNSNHVSNHVSNNVSNNVPSNVSSATNVSTTTNVSSTTSNNTESKSDNEIIETGENTNNDRRPQTNISRQNSFLENAMDLDPTLRISSGSGKDEWNNFIDTDAADIADADVDDINDGKALTRSAVKTIKPDDGAFQKSNGTIKSTQRRNNSAHDTTICTPDTHEGDSSCLSKETPDHGDDGSSDGSGKGGDALSGAGASASFGVSRSFEGMEHANNNGGGNEDEESIGTEETGESHIIATSEEILQMNLTDINYETNSMESASGLAAGSISSDYSDEKEPPKEFDSTSKELNSINERHHSFGKKEPPKELDSTSKELNSINERHHSFEDTDDERDDDQESHFSQEEFFVSLDQKKPFNGMGGLGGGGVKGMPKRPSRCLSSTSLVSLLKIQTIGEDDELNEDMAPYNLEETVQQVAAHEEVDEVSEFTDPDGDDNVLDISDKSDEQYTIGEGEKGTSTFLPMNQTVIEIQNPPPQTQQSHRRISTSASGEEGDSDTFFMQSIKSADITHVSDAPDYDYNSISSSEVESMAGVPADANEVKMPDASLVEPIRSAENVEPIKQKYISPMERKRSQDDLKRRNAQKKEAADSAQRNQLEAKSESKEKTVSDDVCELLGLPKDHIREPHRAIMSRNTELKLRQLGKTKEPKKASVDNSRQSTETSHDKSTALPQSGTVKRDQDAKKEESPNKITLNEVDFSGGAITATSLGRAKSSSLPKRNKMSSLVDKKKKAWDSDSSSGSSSSDSDDLVFGGSAAKPAKSESAKSKTKNWEEVRRQRLQKRLSQRSMKSSDNTDDGTIDPLDISCRTAVSMLSLDDARESSVRNTSTTANTSERYSMNSSGSSRLRVSNRSNPSEDDDDNSVGSTATTISKIGSIFNKSLNFLNLRNKKSAKPEEKHQVDADSTDDEEEEEDSTWDMNILTEGEYYLAMSMLVYIYALLRETSMLGHTDINFNEIDVNSFQSEVGFGSSSSFLGKTKSAGFIVRVVMDELEKKEAFSDFNKNENDISVLREFKNWVLNSRVKQLDSATEGTIKELRRKVARRRWKRAINAVRLMVRLGKKPNSNSNQFIGKSPSNHQRNDSNGSIKSSIEKAARMPGQALRGSMVWLHDHKAQLLNGLGIDGNLTSSMTGNTLVDQQEVQEVQEIINDALEQPRFFREGSLMSNLIESGIEVVWFGDRHPNDVVYSICCNRQQKRVSVVFRGTVNSHNWLMNLKFAMTEHTNPITEDYPGREDEFGLHTGFSLYMTRQRKDDSLTKVEEIISKVDAIGRELAPDGDYELSITGHSLGGALATIFAFYAGTSNTLAQLKTIRVFSYAAPRVGCLRFVHAFQHLEAIGKLCVARFTNTRDVVPLIPFTGVDGFSLGRPYKHVGMHVRLHGVSNMAQYWLRKALDVSYPKHHDWLSEMNRGFWSSIMMNLNNVRGYAQCHTLSEYQTRIHFALEYRNALAIITFFNDKKRNRVKTLDEYYFIRGASSESRTAELTRICLEDRVKESDRRKMRTIIIVLIVVALAEATVLLIMFKGSIRCDSYPALLYPLLPFIGCYEEASQECSIARDARDISSFVLDPSGKSIITSEMSYSYAYEDVVVKSTNDVVESTNVAVESTNVAVEPTLELELPVWGRHDTLSALWGVNLHMHPVPPSLSLKIDSLVSQRLIWDTQLFLRSRKGSFHSEISSIVSTKLRGLISSRA